MAKIKTTINETENGIYKTLSRLREIYTDDDDIARINEDTAKITRLFAKKGLVENEIVQEMISLCRRDIIVARKKLAFDMKLIGDEKAQRELWFLIESREWFLNIVVQDFEGEIESMASELESELTA